jgi:hypothetical protein
LSSSSSAAAGGGAAAGAAHSIHDLSFVSVDELRAYAPWAALAQRLRPVDECLSTNALLLKFGGLGAFFYGREKPAAGAGAGAAATTGMVLLPYPMVHLVREELQKLVDADAALASKAKGKEVVPPFAFGADGPRKHDISFPMGAWTDQEGLGKARKKALARMKKRVKAAEVLRNEAVQLEGACALFAVPPEVRARTPLRLLAVDVETYEKDPSKMLELGWTVYDAQADTFRDRHWILTCSGVERLRNGEFVPDRRDAFAFGTSQRGSIADARAALLADLEGADADAAEGKGAGGAVDYVVGHDLPSDLKHLRVCLGLAVAPKSSYEARRRITRTAAPPTALASLSLTLLCCTMLALPCLLVPAPPRCCVVALRRRTSA